MLGILIVLIFLGFEVLPSPSGPVGDDEGVPDVPETDSLPSMASSWLIPLLGIPLRVRREKLLDSPARKSLYNLVQAHPGIHLRGLVDSSGLGFGAVSYHLRLLQEYGFVSMVPTGIRICFYPVGVEPLSTIPQISRRRIQVLEAVEQSPGAGLRDLGQELGLSPKTVAYHLRALKAAGLVEAEPTGKPFRFRRSPLCGMAQR